MENVISIKRFSDDDFRLYLNYTRDTSDMYEPKKHFSICFIYKTFGQPNSYRSDEYYEYLSDAIKAYNILFDFIKGEINGR